MVQNVGSVYGKVRFRMWGVCMGRQGSECGECVWEGKVQNRRTVKFETIQQQEGLMRMGR